MRGSSPVAKQDEQCSIRARDTKEGKAEGKALELLLHLPATHSIKLSMQKRIVALVSMVRSNKRDAGWVSFAVKREVSAAHLESCNVDYA